MTYRHATQPILWAIFLLACNSHAPPPPADHSESEMTSRLTYDDSIRQLQQIGYLSDDESPPMPDHRPRFDDEEPLGLSFFRTMVANDHLGNLTLRRTYVARSEINAASFSNTDLSESTLCWNDFLDVDFSGASLSRSDMRASRFERCNFDAADLSGCDLRQSSFEGCTFRNANLRGALLAQNQRSALSLTEEQLQSIDWQDDEGETPPGG